MRLPCKSFFAIGGSIVFFGANFFFKLHVFDILNPSSGSFRWPRYFWTTSLFCSSHRAAISSPISSRSSIVCSQFSSSDVAIAIFFFKSSFFVKRFSRALFGLLRLILIFLKHFIMILFRVDSHFSSSKMSINSLFFSVSYFL